MLTKNFYSVVVLKTLKKTIPKSLIAIDGSVHDHVYYYSNTSDVIFNMMYSFKTSTTSAGVIIGTGTTPATVSDYKLDSQITTGVSFVNSGATSFNVDDDGYSMFVTSGVTNNGTEPLPVSEIGLVAQLYNGNSASNYCYPLLDRTVLEEPIVINPGETKQLTYTIRMNYPTA